MGRTNIRETVVKHWNSTEAQAKSSRQTLVLTAFRGAAATTARGTPQSRASMEKTWVNAWQDLPQNKIRTGG
jgi:hypothetical protein